MLRLGENQNLKIIRKTDFGVYLSEGEGEGENVLLPIKQVPPGAKIYDEIKVFLYKDSKDRLIATTNTPKITLGQVRPLKVISVGKIGAFLDWGLEKDLLLPFAEQLRRIEVGDELLIRLYIDKSNRLCGSMKDIYHNLSSNPPYAIGDRVNARIYEFSDNFGTFAAVDDKYSAMLKKSEDVRSLRIGDVINVRITGVKEDGKLDISLNDKAYIQMDKDSEKILSLLEEQGGFLTLGDKSSPEEIMKITGLSKAAFKRAAGRLYKKRIIIIGRDFIKKQDATDLN